MSDDIDVSVTIPEDATKPVLFDVPESAYRFLLVERAHAAAIDGTLGDYVLLGPAGGEQSAWTFYVGKAGTGTVSQRLASHMVQKPWWVRALVVSPRPGHDGFSSASAGFLEGALYRHLTEYRFAVTLNGNTPGDDTPTEKEKARLRRGVLPPITSILRMLGYDLTRTRANAPVRVAEPMPSMVSSVPPSAPRPDPAPAEVTPSESDVHSASPVRPPAQSHPLVGASPSKRVHWAKIRGMVARGYLRDGETLRGRGDAVATVRSDGSLVVNGQVCATPNRAWEVAVSAQPGMAQNAWKWWCAERNGGWPLIAQIRDEYEARHPEDKGQYR